MFFFSVQGAVKQLANDNWPLKIPPHTFWAFAAAEHIMTGEMGFRRYRGCGCLENTLRDIHMSKIGAGLFFEDRSTHCPLQTSLVSHSSPS